MKKPRSERRRMEREAKKLAERRVKLASLERGGAPERPIEVESASTIEVHAAGLPCLGCDAPGTRVEEHAAVTAGDRRVRVARVVCQRCGARREIWFAIRPPSHSVH